MKKHGLYKTKVYNSWAGIIQRCNNKNFKQYYDYGGRGITVCERWLDFSNFLEDMGMPPENTSIDRIDNNKGYFKENCKWSTKKEQQSNRRVCIFLEIDGEKKCITEWAEHFNLPSSLVINRISKLKWTPKEALGLVERNTKKRTCYVRSDAHWVEFNGKKMILSEWCKFLNLNSKTVYSRIMRGASDLKALGLVV